MATLKIVFIVFSKGNGFYGIVTKKIVSTGRELSHGKCVLGGLVATTKMFFRGLPHWKRYLEVRHTENGFQEVATKKMVFRCCHIENGFEGLPYGINGKCFLGGCHKENAF